MRGTLKRKPTGQYYVHVLLQGVYKDINVGKLHWVNESELTPSSVGRTVEFEYFNSTKSIRPGTMRLVPEEPAPLPPVKPVSSARQPPAKKAPAIPASEEAEEPAFALPTPSPDPPIPLPTGAETMEAEIFEDLNLIMKVRVNRIDLDISEHRLWNVGRDWMRASMGRRVRFTLVPNMATPVGYSIQSGSVHLLPEPGEEPASLENTQRFATQPPPAARRKSRVHFSKQASFRPTVDCAGGRTPEYWICPYCEHGENPTQPIRSGQDPIKFCLKCEKLKPKRGVSGRWQSDKEDANYQRFVQSPWACPKCRFEGTGWLQDNCQNCRSPKPQEVEEEGVMWVWDTSSERHCHRLISRKRVRLPRGDPSLHHNVDDLLYLADTGFKAEVVSGDDNCKCCEKPCHYDGGTRVAFSSFYRLMKDGVWNDPKRVKFRRDMLQLVLNKFPRCQCAYGNEKPPLLALPREGRSSVVFRIRGAKHQLRKTFDRIRTDTRKKALAQPEYKSEFSEEDPQICHVIPLQAGGCPKTLVKPGGIGNLVLRRMMCDLCCAIDMLCTDWQLEDHNHNHEGTPYDDRAFFKKHPDADKEFPEFLRKVLKERPQ